MLQRNGTWLRGNATCYKVMPTGLHDQSRVWALLLYKVYPVSDLQKSLSASRMVCIYAPAKGLGSPVQHFSASH